MAVLLYILATLAAYRVTRLIVDDKITEPVTGRLRAWLESRYIARHAENTEHARTMEHSDEYNSPIAYMLTCYWCAGFWVSGMTTLVLWGVYRIDYPILTWLAISTLVGLISLSERD